jgi:hypothetical protein
LDEWLLAKAVADALRAVGRDPEGAKADALLTALLISHEGLLAPASEPAGLDEAVRELFADPAAQDFLQFNTHGGVEYLNKELLDRLLDALVMAAGVLRIEGASECAETIRQAAARAGYVAKRMTFRAQRGAGE